MKKYIILAITILLNMSLLAQMKIEKNQNDLYQKNENFIKTYRIFPTVNMWYFIKLNTRNGQMWQIQFDQKETKQLDTPLNSLSLVKKEYEVDNRFILYPTKNNWNYLLLDQINGKIWQLNWDMKPEKNKISSLNSFSLIEKQNTTNNRFILYPTKNNWNYLLLDKISGKTWQVRWSTKPEEGEIISIQ